MKNIRLKKIYDSLTVKLVQASFELVVHMYLLMQLNPSVEQLSVSDETFFLQEVQTITVSVYNYNLGYYCHILKFLLLIHYLPSMLRFGQKYTSFESVIQFMMILFETTCLVDFVNTTENAVYFNVLLIVKFLRMVSLNWEFLNYFVEFYEASNAAQKKQPSPMLLEILGPPEPHHIISLRTEPIIKLKKKESQVTNTSTEKKLTETTDKKSASSEKKAIKKIKKIIWPSFDLRIKTNFGGVIIVKVENPFNFDQTFETIVQLSKQELLHTKMYYCNEIIRFSHKFGDKQAQAHLYKQLSLYMAELIMI